MNPAENIRTVLESVLPAPDWSIQFGIWTDPGGDTRSAVVRPNGGIGAELVRRPQFTLSLIGSDGGDALAMADAAHSVVEALRSDAGGLVYIEAGEPVYMPTADKRPVFQLALSAITT